ICGALFFGSLGIFWSTLMRSTAAATVLAYGSLLLAMAGVPFVWFVGSLILSTGGNNDFTKNEIYLYLSGLILSSNPLIAMGLSEAWLRSGKPLFVFTDTTLINGH